MNWIAVARRVGALACVACALLMGIWLRLGVATLGALGLVSACVMAVTWAPAATRARLLRWSARVSWAGTLMMALGASIGPARIRNWDASHVVIVLLVATAMLLAGWTSEELPAQNSWRRLAWWWSFMGASAWLAVAYIANSSALFFAGIGLMLACLIAGKVWFRLPGIAILTVNTFILLLVVLPFYDLLTASSDHLNRVPPVGARPYSYEAAVKDHAQFKRWWNFYLGESSRWLVTVFTNDVPPPLGFRLRPNSRTRFFDSRISVNSLGFRGKEIPVDKGNAYRIVALGESTTFGFTTKETDRPWPEQLEDLINRDLHLDRHVEVINAGTPAYTIGHNIIRLPRDILPLHPDMIISYHGINGFNLLNTLIPSFPTRPEVVYQRRPLKLLADCEYHVKLLLNRRRHAETLRLHPPSLSNPMDTPYADAYRRLIAIARTNHIRLVLATFSMAVNEESNPKVIDFYSDETPAVGWRIKANAAHNFIVKELAKENPDVGIVDTTVNLDGRNDYFVDLCHFDTDGDKVMAETMFAGIRQTLETALGGARPVSTTSARKLDAISE